jgi:hypothetical protein
MVAAAAACGLAAVGEHERWRLDSEVPNGNAKVPVLGCKRLELGSDTQF